MSLNNNGELANQGATPVGISDDGRYVLFNSSADNMPGYTPAPPQLIGSVSFLYIRDRQLGTTARVGDAALLQTSGYAQTTSADANIIAYRGMVYYNSPSDYKITAYIYNRSINTITALPDNIQEVSVSADGAYVVYRTVDPVTSAAAMYRYTVATGQSVAINVQASGFALSPNGSHILGYTPSAHGYDIFYQDVVSGQRQVLMADSQGAGSTGLSFDRQGTYVAFYGVTTDPLQTASIAKVVNVLTGDSVVVDTGLHRASQLKLSGDGTELFFSSFTRVNDGTDNQQAFIAKLAPDTTAPVVVGTPDRAANANGWYSANVTINWTAIDASDTATQPPATTAATEGNNVTYTSAPSCDASGNCATGSMQISIDKTRPAVSNLTLTPSIIFLAGTIGISANASDTLSGVTSGEYYIDTDPGVGNGAPLAYSPVTGKLTGNKSVTIGSLAPGVHRLYVRTLDRAGNWSTTINKVFIYI